MLFLTYDNYNRGSFAGVKKKVISQKKVFERLFEEVYHVRFEYGLAFLDFYNQTIDKRNVISRSVFFKVVYGWIIKYKQREVYFRFMFPIDRWIIDFLRELKNQSIRVYFEIPTFPYEDLIKNSRVKTENSIFKKYLKECIPFVITYSPVRDVYGIPVISIQNGVNLDDNPIRSYRARSNDEIILLGVSSMSEAQGYERIIRGIGEYYRDGTEGYDIKLILVGDGRENGYYKQLVNRLNIESRVFFQGVCYGEKLDAMYDNADIGISNLGLYKIGITNGTCLKSREYCARGLPFIYAYSDPGFDADLPFVRCFENDGSNIGINEIISFYKRIDPDSMRNKMRDYAKTHFSWDSIMSEVFDRYSSNYYE